MKQGKATVDGRLGGKVEPRSRAVDPEFAGTIGVARGNHVTEKGDIPFKTIPMYNGKGLSAPMHSQKTHKGGSQGSY